MTQRVKLLALLALLTFAGCERHIGSDADATARCGDGVPQANEECDGEDLHGQSCRLLGFDSGVLSCDAECHLETVDCIPSGPCGDGIAQSAEQRDGEDLAGADCATLGFDTGMLRCTAGCVFDSSGCCNWSSGCGDAIIGCGEECEYDSMTGTPLLGGATCESRGYDAGTLDCRECEFDERLCCDNGACGDGVIHCGEQCEAGANGPYFVDVSTCEDLGFTGGNLGCLDCALDTSGCF